VPLNNPFERSPLAPAPLPGRVEHPRRLPVATPAPTTALEVPTLEAVLAEARLFYHEGLGNGETTHWPVLEQNWTWLRKEITAITGYANQGKSRFILQAMLIKAAFSNWRFLVYVPENEEDFYVEMAETLVGQTANLKFKEHRMGWADLEAAVQWLYDHFTVVKAPDGCTPQQLLDHFTLQAAQRPYDGVLIDPWNQLTHDFQSREDLYLSQQFSVLKRYAIRHNLCVLVTAHPAGQVKSREGKLLVPDAYSISGGKMWANKFDNVLAVFRPAFPDPKVELWIHKIKKQGRVGRPGMLELNFNIKQARYFPEIGDMQHPLEKASFNAPGSEAAVALPESTNPYPNGMRVGTGTSSF
jgi:twinkle protein